MRNHLGVYLKVAFICMALSLSQCGNKKTKSQQVAISVSPSSPIVITSDVTINKGGSPVVIKGPWFRFQVSISNQSDTPITVISLHVEVTGLDVNGQSITASKDFDPGEFNFSDMSGQTCIYTDFGEFQKGGTSAGVVVGTKKIYNDKSLFVTKNPGCNTDGVAVFYFDGAPKPATGSTNYHYSVMVKPVGWFGTRDAPSDRFENFTTVYTQ